MNITGIRFSMGPSGDYRLRLPLQMLARRGHTVKLIQVRQGMAFTPEWLYGSDVVILQACDDPQFLEMIDCFLPEHRPAVVYEVDDILWEMTPDRHGYEEFHAKRKEIIHCIRRSDAVFTSTPELAERVRVLRPLDENVTVLPNCIDYGIRDWGAPYSPRLAEGKVVIGWAGGIRPSADMVQMGTALIDVLTEQPNTVFAIAGAEGQCFEFAYSLGFREEHLGQLCILPISTFDSYPQMISLFDIGIAPLEDSLFNRCKSELKLLEYGAWGIPYVASAVTPYVRYAHFSRGDCGYLADSVRQWRNCLTRLVTDEELRRMKGQAGREFVRRSYNLNERCLDWEAALRRVLKRQESPMAVREWSIR